ncbi:MAG: hypothetical protein AAGA03_09185 [Planctomycetota bacterium]
MHAGLHQRLSLAAILVVAAMLGCRSTRGVEQTVQVSTRPSPGLEDIDAPPQRLATAEPTRGSVMPDKSPSPKEPTRSQRSLTDSVATLANLESTLGGRDSSADESIAKTSAQQPADAASQPVTMSLSSRRQQASAPKSPSTTAVTASTQAAVASTASVAKPATTTPPSASQPASEDRSSFDSSRQRVSLPPADSGPSPALTQDSKLTEQIARQAAKQLNMSPEKILDALKDSPPEVRDQAIRQMLALVSMNAQPSSQPTAMDSTYLQTLAGETLLDNQPPTVGGPRPTPLGSSKPNATTERSVPTAPSGGQGEKMPPEPTVSPEVAVAPTEPNQPIARKDVVRAGVQPPPGGSHVRPASAQRDANHDMMVARADVGKVESAVAQVGAALLSDQALFDLLMQRLKQPIAGESDANRHRREIMVRHLMVLSGDVDDAVREIDGLSSDEQEYLRNQLMSLWRVVDPEGHPVPSRRFASALDNLRSATQYLAASTDSLEVRSLAFCTAIESYGQIEEFVGNRFDPGQQVILYCEIENFAVKKTSEGFQTHLQGSYAVYDGNDQKQFSQQLPADKQTSRNFLRDYFIAYQMYLPRQLAPGTYRLELTMEDVEGQKYGQSSIPFEIAENK